MGMSQMLSNAAKKSLELVAVTPVLDKLMYRISMRYIDEYNNYSYDFSKNGELELIKACSKLFGLDERATVFDVGANVGGWTKSCKKFIPNAQYYLFEISSETFKILSEKMQREKGIALQNVALGASNGTIEFKNYGAGKGSNSTVLDAEFNKNSFEIVSAEQMRGDAFCVERGITRINLLKIDVEGAEFNVLSGFEDLLKNKKIDVIQFEYGYTHGDAGTLMKDFFNLFGEHGYELGPLRKRGVEFKTFSYSNNDFKSGPNYVACLPEFVPHFSKF